MKNDSQEIFAARNGSPLLIGLGEEENFFASDAAALVEHTKKVIYLNDLQLAKISPREIEVFDLQGRSLTPEIKILQWDIEQAQKQGNKHFMIKEILEQPEILELSLSKEVKAKLSGSRIIIAACGTASYAGLLGTYLIERIAGIPTQNFAASEFRYQYPVLGKEDLVIAISQSGETADTLAAVRLARERGARTLGIINVRDSTLAREVDEVIYTLAGPEIGVASSKAFLAQIITLYQLAFHWAGKKLEVRELKKALEKTLELNDYVQHLAEKYCQSQNFLYIGRNLSYPLALEGALKLKEISYIHAEAYPAGELKHGPLALVSEDMPTLAICPEDEVYEKMLSNIQEIKARKGKVIALTTEGNEKIRALVDDVIYVPKVDQLWYPLVCLPPLQLFAYQMADRRGCDVDKPRNLAKSVTVE